MREILFRFWSEKAKEMISFELMEKECNRLSILKVDGFIPMQYTGLNDKNGKKIFEGDELKAQTAKGEHVLTVEWVSHSGYTGFMLYGRDRRFHTSLTSNSIYNMSLEIIGNIHLGVEV